MTSLLEKAISIIAPNHCFVCGNESNVLCELCFLEVFDESCDVCFVCNAPVIEGTVCRGCRSKTSLEHVWIATTYEGVTRQIIRAYKFERLRSAHVVLAQAMLHTLPYLDDIVVVFIPTAPERIRLRGYDQSKLLAKYIAKERGWHQVTALRRLHGLRQVGSGRQERAAQARTAYELISKEELRGRHVLLVDDITTTGATLSTAARLIMQAGADRVDGLVIAKHLLK